MLKFTTLLFKKPDLDCLEPLDPLALENEN